YLNQETTQDLGKLLTTKIEKLPSPNEEELEIISQLYLTVKKFALLASQAQYLSINEREQIIENFPNFSQDSKLRLVNSGMNNVGINTLKKKQIFVNLNHTIDNEKQNFGLTLKEKENILRMFINELDLTKEQQQALEQVGVRFFNASE
ncbi:10452_t:CDS:1, partial [Cetraspora pellucida]